VNEAQQISLEVKDSELNEAQQISLGAKAGE
jgi:hypothetical protein